MQRETAVAFLIALTALATAVAETPGAVTPGIVAEKPSAGRYVETDRGFMVPYTMQVPGAEAKFEMVPVPGGDYKMTRHGRTFTVRVAPFWMGKTEVTWAEYQAYMEMTDAFARFDDLGLRQITEERQLDAITSPSKLYEPTFTYASGDDPDQPAVSMTQYAAKQYSKWLSLASGQFFRLPSEAEWEYACRAGGEGAYAFGDDPAELDAYAWTNDNSGGLELSAVAAKKPNAWGLHDMHGNAAEWVLDAYEPGEAEPAAGSTVSVKQAIAFPTELYPRVLKGGSWQQEADACTVAARWASDDDEWRINDPNSPQSPWWLASDEGQQVGFRLVRPMIDAPREEKETYWQADVPRIAAHADRRIDEEGRGERGLVDEELPAAIKNLQ